MATNQAQREQWNAESQARTWPKRERITEQITPRLLEILAPHHGERVLDVGCGGGLSAIAAATAVGPAGSVTGFDLSAPLVGLATERAAGAKIDNVRFVVGDAQVDDIPGGPFDAAMSQFGVMFFEDPVAAFGNIRRHLQPGGRLAFACWQPPAKNVWFPGPVLAQYQPQPASPPPPGGPPPPGPFAFADVEYVRRILDGAGFRDVRHDELIVETAVAEDSIIDRETLAPMRLDAEREEQAWRDLEKHKASLLGADGLLHLRLSAWAMQAVNL